MKNRVGMDSKTNERKELVWRENCEEGKIRLRRL